MYLKESCFSNGWKISSVVPVFKNVGEKSTAKNYPPVSLLSVVSNLDMVVDRLKKCDLVFLLISSMATCLRKQW